MNSRGFAIKSVYPSELGMHIEHYTEVEAQAAYTDAKSKGMNVRLDGSILTWQFYNPRSPRPIGIGQERAKNPINPW